MNRARGLAYLFERFPTFTQTFCVREVCALWELGLRFPVFSLRSTADEPEQSYPAEIRKRTVALPPIEPLSKRWWLPLAFRARCIKRRIYRRWGPEGGRLRAFEAAWLEPRLRRAGAGHVHAHFTGLAARTAFWLKGCCGMRFSLTAHANDFFVETPGSFLDDLFREAEFVVTVSDFSRRRLADRFPFAAEKIHRVYNGIDTASFAGERRPAQRATILSIGRYIEKKGFDDLILACRELGGLDYSCVLVGEGPEEQRLRGLIRWEGLEGRVELAGPKPLSEIQALLSGSQVFALACRREPDGGMDNLPTVIAEAMAAGLPVVSTELAGIPEMVQHGRTGLLAPPGDPRAFGRALRELLLDPARSREMGREGFRVAAEKFDSAATARQLRDLFVSYGAVSAQ